MGIMEKKMETTILGYIVVTWEGGGGSGFRGLRFKGFG